MSRKLEFNYDEALKRATHLFWNKGYSNTSLRDLLKVMGIGEGSFYNKVKSKKALYLECLRYYNDDVTRRRMDVLASEPNIKPAVRKFFANVLDELDDPKTPRVCLMAGSLGTDVLEAKDLNAYVINEFALFEKGFIGRLEAAKKNGELPKNFAAETAAGTIITYLQGLFRVIRVIKDRPQMERQIDTLLTGLGL